MEQVILAVDTDTQKVTFTWHNRRTFLQGTLSARICICGCVWLLLKVCVYDKDVFSMRRIMADKKG
uniref:Uncharacterized protein n=1 Tax=Arundo donax TaxID=35708 RepID=A0A0A9FR74_ARUDO